MDIERISMKKTRKLSSKLSLHRETLRQLDPTDLDKAQGGFTGDCSAHPSHAQCSNPCTLSCDY